MKCYPSAFIASIKERKTVEIVSDIIVVFDMMRITMLTYIIKRSNITTPRRI